MFPIHRIEDGVLLIEKLKKKCHGSKKSDLALENITTRRYVVV